MKKVWGIVGDIIHAFLLCLLFYAIIKAIVGPSAFKGMADGGGNIRILLGQIGINEIYTFIGSTAFVLFGIVGIYDFAYLNGLYILVPPSFVHAKDRNNLKQAEKMMELYYNKDIDFIKEYEKERSDYMLQAIGLEERQFRTINYEIIKGRTMTERNIYALKVKAEKLLFQKDYIIDQSKLENSKRVYDKVDYYINLYTALYDAETCKSIGSVMSRFIILSLKERLTEVDYLIIPQGSNFLLGLEVGKQLGKPVISVLSEERIYTNKFWDGNYNEDKKNNIIVIHDVLVTGERVCTSIEKLPKNSYELYGIFCLMKYVNKDFDATKYFSEHGIEKKRINYLFEVDETILGKVCSGEYEYRYD